LVSPRTILSLVGRVIVIAGALWKAGREISEMIDMGLMKYLRSTVSNFFKTFQHVMDYGNF
jgi:hypothetical protein